MLHWRGLVALGTGEAMTYNQVQFQKYIHEFEGSSDAKTALGYTMINNFTTLLKLSPVLAVTHYLNLQW